MFAYEICSTAGQGEVGGAASWPWLSFFFFFTLVAGPRRSLSLKLAFKLRRVARRMASTLEQYTSYNTYRTCTILIGRVLCKVTPDMPTRGLSPEVPLSRQLAVALSRLATFHRYLSRSNSQPFTSPGTSFEATRNRTKRPCSKSGPGVRFKYFKVLK